MNASLKTAHEHLDQVHSELNKQKLIKKYCTTYRVTSQIIQSEKDTSDPKKYKQQHSNEYALHQSVKNELRSMGINTLPNSDRIDRIISNLENEYSSTQKEIHDLQKQRTTLSIVEQNFQQLLIEPTQYQTAKSLQHSQHL